MEVRSRGGAGSCCPPSHRPGPARLLLRAVPLERHLRRGRRRQRRDARRGRSGQPAAGVQGLRGGLRRVSVAAAPVTAPEAEDDAEDDDSRRARPVRLPDRRGGRARPVHRGRPRLLRRPRRDGGHGPRRPGPAGADDAARRQHVRDGGPPDNGAAFWASVSARTPRGWEDRRFAVLAFAVTPPTPTSAATAAASTSGSPNSAPPGCCRAWTANPTRSSARRTGAPGSCTCWPTGRWCPHRGWRPTGRPVGTPTGPAWSATSG